MIELRVELYRRVNISYMYWSLSNYAVEFVIKSRVKRFMSLTRFSNAVHCELTTTFVEHMDRHVVFLPLL